jgi:hypothetical protein
MSNANKFTFIVRSGPPLRGVEKDLEISDIRSHTAAVIYGRKKLPEPFYDKIVAGRAQQRQRGSGIVRIAVAASASRDNPSVLVVVPPSQRSNRTLDQHDSEAIDRQHRLLRFWADTIGRKISDSSMMPWAGHSASEVHIGEPLPASNI